MGGGQHIDWPHLSQISVLSNQWPTPQGHFPQKAVGRWFSLEGINVASFMNDKPILGGD